MQDAGKILVVAPHPDDESLGCAGLMALMARNNSSVEVLFACDGGGSHPGSRTHPPDVLARLRAEEARAALERLGIGANAARFLGLRDGAAPFPGQAGFACAVGKVSNLIESFSPDLLLVPWRHDNSPDHRAVWHIIREALLVTSCTPPRVLEYPIWVWEDHENVPSVDAFKVWRLDISTALDAKRRAIACHRSQLGQVVKDASKGFALHRTFLANFDFGWELYFEEREPAI